MTVDLDEKDYQILRQLEKNSRMSVKDISENSNISVPTVNARLTKLLSLGVKFTVTPNIIDSERIIGFLSIKIVSEEVSSLTNFLSKKDGVEEIYHTTGENDVIVKINMAHIDDFKKLLDNDLLKFPRLERVQSNIILKTIPSNMEPIKTMFTLKLKCASCKRLISNPLIEHIVDTKFYYFCSLDCKTSFP